LRQFVHFSLSLIQIESKKVRLKFEIQFHQPPKSYHTVMSKHCEGIVLSSKKSCCAAATSNGFCKRHQSQIFLRDAKEKGEVVCRMFDRGCRNYLTDLDKTNNFKTCLACRSELLGKISSCEHDGCKNKVDLEKRFCGKHARDVFREKEKTGEVVYCNIDRGCASVLSPGEKRCVKCRKAKDEKVTNEIKEIREKYIKCLRCDKNDKTISSFCDLCNLEVSTIINTDVNRNIHYAWYDFKNGAIKRDLELTIDFEKFKDIVIRPCFFCGEFSLSNYNGVDRYDNRKGYISSNCVACCTMCNIMKGGKTPHEFHEKIKSISQFQNELIPLSEESITKYKSFQTKSVDCYNVYKKLATEKRGIEFELTNEQFYTLRNGRCYLCGIRNSDKHLNGIDRVDSTKGYIVSNCRACCAHCNLMKNEYDIEEFLKKCTQIHTTWAPVDEFAAEITESTEITKQPTEIYRAHDIYEILQGGTVEFLAWARKAGKSEQFMEGVRSVTTEDKHSAIEEIRHQIELERKRGEPEERKHIQASTMLAMLMNSPKSTFVDLYSSIYELSNSFDTQLDELISQLALVGSKEGAELCKKFLRAENMRRKSKRNTELKRELREPPPRAPWKAEPIIEAVKNTVVFDIPLCEEAPQKEILHVKKSQWKASEIYKNIKTANGEQYKEYCISNNVVDDSWNDKWNTFIEAIKLSESFADVKETITEFIVELRSIRHNLLLDKKTKANLLERKDREAWPVDTILYAFKQNKTAAFKKHMDNLNGGKVNNWEIKWNTFIETISTTEPESEKKDLISKFLVNMRAARYLANKTKLDS
jgi:hypothetical protein